MTIRDLKVLDDMWHAHLARADVARQQRTRCADLTEWIENARTTIAELAQKVEAWGDERYKVSQAAHANEKQSADYADLVEEKRQGTDWTPPDPVPPTPPSEPGTIFDQVSSEMPRPERTLASAECKPPCSEHIVRDLLHGGPWVHFIGGRAECPGDGLATVAEPAPEPGVLVANGPQDTQLQPAVAPAEQTQPDATGTPASEDTTEQEVDR